MTTVLILMATHNGGSFLAEQLDSIAAQSHADWRLMVSDDASSDNTPAVLQAFRDARPAGQVTLVSGPGRGAAANFRSLIRQANREDVIGPPPPVVPPPPPSPPTM